VIIAGQTTDAMKVTGTTKTAMAVRTPVLRERMFADPGFGAAGGSQVSPEQSDFVRAF
jgi:hypothetical protein